MTRWVFHVPATIAIEVTAETAAEADAIASDWQARMNGCDYFTEADTHDADDDDGPPEETDGSVDGTALVYVDVTSKPVRHDPGMVQP